MKPIPHVAALLRAQFLRHPARIERDLELVGQLSVETLHALWCVRGWGDGCVVWRVCGERKRQRETEIDKQREGEREMW